MTRSSYYLVGVHDVKELELKIFAIVQSIDKFGIYREIKTYTIPELNALNNKMNKIDYPFYNIAYVSKAMFIFVPISVLDHFYLKETNPVKRYRIPAPGEIHNIIHEYNYDYIEYTQQYAYCEVNSISTLDDLSPTVKRTKITVRNPQYLSLMYKDSLRRKHGIEPETNNPLGVII